MPFLQIACHMVLAFEKNNGFRCRFQISNNDSLFYSLFLFLDRCLSLQAQIQGLFSLFYRIGCYPKRIVRLQNYVFLLYLASFFIKKWNKKQKKVFFWWKYRILVSLWSDSFSFYVFWGDSSLFHKNDSANTVVFPSFSSQFHRSKKQGLANSVEIG